MEHLSQQQIEQYVARTAPVDDILAYAEHLDGCFDCRDRAAALVDDGSHDLPHVRKTKTSTAGAATPRRHRVLLWTAIGVGVVAAAVALIAFWP